MEISAHKMILSCLFFCAVAVQFLSAENYYVDPNTGDNNASGLSASVNDKGGPLKTIERAVALAKPGDTIHLASGKVFKEQAGFYGKSGEPGKPITLDGHGATISGSKPINLDDWKTVSPGLFYNEAIYLRWLAVNKNIVKYAEEWVEMQSFVFDGQLKRMNHSRKAPATPYLIPDDLKFGEWTYQKKDNHRFYIKIDPSKTLADYRIEEPVIVSAVQISGTVSHLVIKNMTVTHVLNDGYALTVGNDPGSKVRDIVFENIRSLECGDDGFSAHGDCEVRVDGFESIGNSTGICSGGGGTSTYRRVWIRDNHGYNLSFYYGTHLLTDSIVECSGLTSGLMLENAHTNETLSLRMENVLVLGPKGSSERAMTVRINERCRLEAQRVTFAGLSFLAVKGSALTLRECIIAGGTPFQMNIFPDATWEADRNFYDLGSVRTANKSFTQKDFDAWRAITKQDADSVWAQANPNFTEKGMTLRAGESKVGFDADTFKKAAPDFADRLNGAILKLKTTGGKNP